MKEVNKKDFGMFANTNIKECFQHLEQDNEDVGKIIGEAISIGFRNNCVTKEVRCLNNIETINYDDSLLKLHYVSEENYDRKIFVDYIPDMLYRNAIDIKLLVEYNQELYHVLIRGIYNNSSIIACTENFTLMDLMYSCSCENLIGVGITVYDIKFSKEIYFRFINAPADITKEQYISIMSEVLEYRISDDSYNAEYKEYGINSIEDLKKLDFTKIYFTRMCEIDERWFRFDENTDKLPI